MKNKTKMAHLVLSATAIFGLTSGLRVVESRNGGTISLAQTTTAASELSSNAVEKTFKMKTKKAGVQRDATAKVNRNNDVLTKEDAKGTVVLEWKLTTEGKPICESCDPLRIELILDKPQLDAMKTSDDLLKHLQAQFDQIESKMTEKELAADKAKEDKEKTERIAKEKADKEEKEKRCELDKTSDRLKCFAKKLNEFGLDSSKSDERKEALSQVHDLVAELLTEEANRTGGDIKKKAAELRKLFSDEIKKREVMSSVERTIKGLTEQQTLISQSSKYEADLGQADSLRNSAEEKWESSILLTQQVMTDPSLSPRERRAMVKEIESLRKTAIKDYKESNKLFNPAYKWLSHQKPIATLNPLLARNELAGGLVDSDIDAACSSFENALGGLSEITNISYQSGCENRPIHRVGRTSQSEREDLLSELRGRRNGQGRGHGLNSNFFNTGSWSQFNRNTPRAQGRNGLDFLTTFAQQSQQQRASFNNNGQNSSSFAGGMNQNQFSGNNGMWLSDPNQTAFRPQMPFSNQFQNGGMNGGFQQRSPMFMQRPGFAGGRMGFRS